MKIEEILGKREDQRLEFKSAKVLAKEPESIARSVVGMLNAGGGEIWIGVDDEDDVAVALNPVANAEREKARLRDFLLETLDPSPISEEVTIEVIQSGHEQGFLVVRVRPQENEPDRWPYAFRKRGGWHFLRRVDARNHPMSRDEVFGHPFHTGQNQSVDEAVQKLVEARREFQMSGRDGLWLGLQPARTLDLSEREQRFVQIAQDPSVTGNRLTGWSFALTNREPRWEQDRFHWGVGPCLTGESQVEVYENGRLVFWASLLRLQGKCEEGEIWPYALLELPISAFRIAREIYRNFLEPSDLVAVRMALFGVSGWKLRGGTPGQYSLGDQRRSLGGQAADMRREAQEEPDLVWEPPPIMFREIDEAPDRCGFRLVRRVYRDFGFREKDIPREYDRESEKLILPE